MIDTPTAEEPPIAEVEAAEEVKPKRRRSRKAPQAEETVVEPASAPVPPVEPQDEAAPAAKPARKRRSKAAEPSPSKTEATTEAVPLPAANNDTSDEETGEPRRGWWQRTFG
jgi:ribonuclease E